MKVQVRFFENPYEMCFYKRVFDSAAETLIPRKGDFLSIDDEVWKVKQIDWGEYDCSDDGNFDMIEVLVEHADMNEYYGGFYAED